MSRSEASENPGTTDELRARLWRLVQRELGAGAESRHDSVPGRRWSERELAQAMRQGDPLAWDAFAKAENSGLLGYALARISDRPHAEDVVQDAFREFLIKREGIQEDVPVGVQMLGFLRICVLRHRDYQARLFSPEEVVDMPSDEPEVSEVLAEGEDWKRLERALLARCNELEQEVIVRLLEGAARADIARDLNLTTEHVRSLKFRAIQKLKDALGGPA